MTNATILESALKKDRAFALGGMVVAVGLAWLYLLYLAWDMRGMDMEMGASMGMAQESAWGVVEFALTFVMWSVMMVAMMVPSAAPVILTFGTVNRTRRAQQRPFVPLGVFVAGYVIVWTAFSAAAALTQGFLHGASLLLPNMSAASPWLAGSLLVIAGVFQWTRLKYACLTECRSPLSFVISEWREGTGGALVMGVRHGFYCLGCCWALMALLWVLGVMNLLWIVALAAFVLVEKVAPGGRRLSRATGSLLILWGVVLPLVA